MVRIEPLPAAKIAGAIYLLLGLAFIPFFMTGPPTGKWWSDVGFPLSAPLIYGLGGFLLGGVLSWLYNLVARWCGGLEVTISSDDGTYPAERNHD